MNPKRFFVKHRFRLIVIVLIIVSFTGGFYTYAALVKQLDLLIPIVIIFALLTSLGSGADFLGLFQKFYDDIKKEEKMPTLEYDDVVLISRDYEEYGKKVHEKTYLLGISNIKKVGMVKDCHAFMYVEGTPLRHIIAMWNDNKQQYNKISVYDEIELFKATNVLDEKEIVFLSSSRDIDLPSTPVERARISYEQIKDNKLTVIFGAEGDVKLPDPWSYKIKDIEKMAVIK